MYLLHLFKLLAGHGSGQTCKQPYAAGNMGSEWTTGSLMETKRKWNFSYCTLSWHLQMLCFPVNQHLATQLSKACAEVSSTPKEPLGSCQNDAAASF